MGETARIVVVDDHDLYRKGIMMSIEELPFAEVVGEASNGQELIQLLKKKEADIILLDVKMPKMDGIETTRRILNKYPNLKVIAMTAFPDSENINKMLDSGVQGLLFKNIKTADLEYALKSVIDGKNWYSPEVIEYLKQQSSKKASPNVTKRETEILRLVAKGYTNKQIADRLNVSLRTITNHRANMHKKIGVSNTVQLLSWCIRHNVLESLN